jgi:hypothetical protein
MGGKGSPREGREEFSGHCALMAPPKVLVVVLVKVCVPFVFSEKNELVEEFVRCYQSQVHLRHWDESNNYDRFCQTRSYI